MNRLPAVLVFFLSTVIFGVAQGSASHSPGPAAYVNSSTAIDGGQKAEPNPQNPAAPQANTGQTNAATASPAGATSGSEPPRATPAPDPANNAALQGRIQQALNNDPTLAGGRASVNVTDNAIALSGTVASSKDKLTAERIAQSFDNNRKFEDKLMVAGQGPATGNPQQK